MNTMEIDCGLCTGKDRCLWRWQTDAMRHQYCEDYNPITVKDLNHDEN